MKILGLLLFLFGLVFAQEVLVEASKFSADEKNLIGIFEGNVLVQKDKDKLKAKKLVVNLNDKRVPIKYKATGSPEFNITLNGKTYFGKGKILIYEPEKNTYSILGDAFLEEEKTNRKVFGNNIIINQKEGSYKVDGQGNKPVKFIFNLKEEKNK